MSPWSNPERVKVRRARSVCRRAARDSLSLRSAVAAACRRDSERRGYGHACTVRRQRYATEASTGCAAGPLTGLTLSIVSAAVVSFGEHRPILQPGLGRCCRLAASVVSDSTGNKLRTQTAPTDDQIKVNNCNHHHQALPLDVADQKSVCVLHIMT